MRVMPSWSPECGRGKVIVQPCRKSREAGGVFILLTFVLVVHLRLRGEELVPNVVYLLAHAVHLCKCLMPRKVNHIAERASISTWN